MEIEIGKMTQYGIMIPVKDAIGTLITNFQLFIKEFVLLRSLHFIKFAHPTSATLMLLVYKYQNYRKQLGFFHFRTFTHLSAAVRKQAKF